VADTIYELSCCGRRASTLPASTCRRPLDELVPAALRRQAPARLPEVSEIELVRHYRARGDYGVDEGTYPRLLHDEVQPR
jgi:glycine dehydrogenase subunit 2